MMNSEDDQSDARSTFIKIVYGRGINAAEDRNIDLKCEAWKSRKYEEIFKYYMLKHGASSDMICYPSKPKDKFSLQCLDKTYQIVRDYDYIQTGTIKIERWLSIEGNLPGWFETSKADKLVVFVTTEDFYTVDMKALKALFELNTDLWHALIVPKKGGRYHSLMYLTSLCNVIVESWVNTVPKKKKESD